MTKQLELTVDSEITRVLTEIAKADKITTEAAVAKVLRLGLSRYAALRKYGLSKAEPGKPKAGKPKTKAKTKARTKAKPKTSKPKTETDEPVTDTGDTGDTGEAAGAQDFFTVEKPPKRRNRAPKKVPSL